MNESAFKRSERILHKFKTNSDEFLSKISQYYFWIRNISFSKEKLKGRNCRIRGRAANTFLKAANSLSTHFDSQNISIAEKYLCATNY